MVLNAEIVDGVTIVQLPETINSTNSRNFERDMAPLMTENSRFVFDLVQLKHLDSMGLGAMVSCVKHLRTSDGDLKLCGMSKQIRTLFELVRMHHVFDIFNTRQEAVESYRYS
jgi:anti-sigma B factor antagonist